MLRKRKKVDVPPEREQRPAPDPHVPGAQRGGLTLRLALVPKQPPGARRDES